MKSLPKFLQKYFWDVNFSKLDKKKYSFFIIERILEQGDEKAVRWLKRNFTLRQIKNTLYCSRNISPKSANFWQFVFGPQKNKILCVGKSSQKKPEKIWKY